MIAFCRRCPGRIEGFEWLPSTTAPSSARSPKPGIPLVGQDGVLARDEIEMEKAPR